MISGANENELEIANARADVLLMWGSETLKVIDKYYEQQLEAYENMRKDLLDLILYQYPALSQSESDFKDDLLNIVNKVGSDK